MSGHNPNWSPEFVGEEVPPAPGMTSARALEIPRGHLRGAWPRSHASCWFN